MSLSPRLEVNDATAIQPAVVPVPAHAAPLRLPYRGTDLRGRLASEGIEFHASGRARQGQRP